MNRIQSASVEVTDAPEIDETAELMKLAGNPTRLKLLYLLETLTEVSVSDLSELLSVSVSAVSQHLAKLRAHRLSSTSSG
jgi:DNA-binding transcriptional ArsR family regulator